ncbi:MAG TPA: hypothetical protein PLO56_16445, partial [Rhodothermales bacterium]|nr:hypothetical protein [Rhodothermales bacterium]
MSAPGIDGIRAAELYAYLVGHWQELQHSVMDGTYRPEAVRRVEIPKPDGGVRQLGIPTVWTQARLRMCIWKQWKRVR